MFSAIRLIKKDQTPLYMQLANGLSTFIRNGQLPPGTKLPTIRSLAKELKINRDTVVSAYKVLEQRGLTYGQPGSGTYVSTFSVTTPADLIPCSNEQQINFATVSLPNDHCPIEIIEYIASDIFSIEGWNAFYDYNGNKYQMFKSIICSYLQLQGIRATSKQIRAIQNTMQLFQLLGKNFSKPGICVESPCKGISLLQQCGLRVFEVPLENDGMDIQSLEKILKTQHIQYIYVTPYLQNPTGICYSTEKKLKLIELANQYNIYIIEEDSYSDLLLDHVIHLPIHSHFSNDRVIYIKNFSKLYLPKLPYSFVVFPYYIADVLSDTYTYNFTDALFHYYLEKDIWRNSSAYTIDSYKNKYKKLLELIDCHLMPYMTYTSSFGGLYVWLTINCPHITTEELCNLLLSKGIVVAPASLFYTNHKENMPHIRISIASVSMMDIEKGITTIANILKNYQ